MVESAKAPIDSEAPRFSQVHARKRRIMLVDDEPIIVDAGKRILSYLGYAVIGVTESRDALHRIQENPNSIELLITDQSMPSMSGCDLAREARKVLPDLPVIITTGSSASQAELRELVSSAVLFKPFLASDLSNAIESLLATAPPAAKNQAR